MHRGTKTKYKKKQMALDIIFDQRRKRTIVVAIVTLTLLVVCIILSNWMHTRSRARKREKTCIEHREEMARQLIRSAQQAITSGTEASRKQSFLVTAAIRYQHAISMLSAAQNMDPENTSGIDIASLYQDCLRRRNEVLTRISRLSGGKFQTKQHKPQIPARYNNTQLVRTPPGPGRI